MKDPLSVTHPKLAAEWHPTKNGESDATGKRVEQAVRAAWAGYPGLAVIAAAVDPQIKIDRVLKCVRALL